MRSLNPAWTFDQIDVGVAYRDTRDRITALVSDLTPAQWETVVPHCPSWTIRETLAHLSGVVDDAINANLEGVATDPWTAAQVAKRTDMSGPDIVEEWNTYAPFVDARFSEVGLPFARAAFDVVTHEHDLRFALTQPGGRQSDALRLGLYLFANGSVSNAGAQLIVDGVTVYSDEPAEPTFTLRASLFDTVRSFGSRRSEHEIRQLDITGDVDAMLEMTPFGLPEQSLGES
jgi:uncharacterized protein (TIGR03083 family)